MIEERLYLAVITYNRADRLEQTLNTLATSPFRNCHIAVLDNCSTDRTPEVCRELAAILPNLRIVRHIKNIGASPNYLRALELSTSDYTWILGDDDHLDFSDSQDVIDALERRQVDLVSVGSPAQGPAERGVNASSWDLIQQGTRFFSTFTFITGVIFRTSLFDSRCVFEGYRNVHNLYPHFPFICKAVAERFSTYSSKQWIVTRDQVEENHLSYLSWLKVWVYSCAMIEDRQLRRKAICDFSEQTLHPRMLAFSVARSAALGRSLPWRDICAIGSILIGEQKIKWLLCVPLFLVPGSIFRRIRRWHWDRKYRALGTAPPDRSSFDPMRL
jgi:glycosyltransferase involved in cell wall biosynthesis